MTDSATNNEKKSITLHQGVGEDTMEIKVQVTQEELDNMEQLRRFSPKKWEGKDLELLQFVRELKKTEADKVHQSIIEEKKEKTKRRLRWIIGIIALLYLISRIITFTLKKQREEEMRQLYEDHPELMHELLKSNGIGQFKPHINTEEFIPKINGFFFDEISFQYPIDWSFEVQEGHVRSYYGCNKQDNQAITYSWGNGETNLTAEELLKNTNSGLKTKYKEIQFFPEKKITYSSYDAVSQNFCFCNEGMTIFGQIVSIVQNNSICTIIKLAESKKDLVSDDFKLMESTFHMPLLPV